MKSLVARPADSRRLVVKIGSALLVDPETRQIKASWLAALAADIAALKAGGRDLLIVSSGAVSVGRQHLGLAEGTLRLAEKQAAAACGQARLVEAYQSALAPHALTAAQILLTIADTEERRRHLNARATLETLFGLGAVPIVNENDTVTTEEIRFGDNDRLAARVAQMIGADLLVLLSDIDGLYTADPRKAPDARLIRDVPRLNDEIDAMAGEPPPGHSSGGMVTKLAAARIATAAGCAMIIGRGTVDHPLALLNQAESARTLFHPTDTPIRARKRWIAGHVSPKGTLTIDAGAAKALAGGKSLLPAGVTAVGGDFGRGDLVIVLDSNGRQLARGLAAYDSGDAARIAGHKSAEIGALLGYSRGDALIHRDDLVLPG